MIRFPLNYLSKLHDIREDMLCKKQYYILPSKFSDRTKPEYSDINNGYCREFAYRALGVFGHNSVYHEIEFKGIPHAFVEFNGKYYDAECIDGADYYLELPIFKTLDWQDNVITRKLRRWFDIGIKYIERA